jgi:hypothetical protein
MRYTEARLRRIAEELLADINKDTVDFQSNFDDSLTEPTVLPGKFPNLLVNGSSGIAVGMATNMAPHNLREVIDGMIAYIDNKEITIQELMQLLQPQTFRPAVSFMACPVYRKHSSREEADRRSRESRDRDQQLTVKTRSSLPRFHTW